MSTAKEILGFFGGYVVIQGRNGEEAEIFFSSDHLPRPGNDQPKQPFVIFQEIFLSFYEELQVFIKTLWRLTKLKINMPYKKCESRQQRARSTTLQKIYRSQGRIWNKFGRSIAGSVRYQEAFSQSKKGTQPRMKKDHFRKEWEIQPQRMAKQFKH